MYLETEVNEKVKRKETTPFPYLFLHKIEWHLHDCINKMSLVCTQFWDISCANIYLSANCH